MRLGWSGGHKLLVSETIQASAMDCGPAALSSILDGFGVAVSFGRLREACQTDVDGTSIDTIEEVANDLGLEAEQIMAPVDHVLLAEASALPAITVVRLPNGNTHFQVLWRRHGGVVQVMDPASGRRWLSSEQVAADLFVHRTAVPVEAFEGFARGDAFRGALRHRFRDVGVDPGESDTIVEAALAEEWESIAALDAALRLVGTLVRAGGIKKGREARSLVERLQVATLQAADPQSRFSIIPEGYWFARPVDGDNESVTIRGAVLVRIRGRRIEPADAETDRGRQLSPELSAALAEPPASPWRDLLRLIEQDGAASLGGLCGAIALSAAAVGVEALLLRGLLEIGRDLGVVGQRLGAVTVLLAFVAGLLVLQLSIAQGALRLGRRLEERIRMALMRKIPRLGDRYFQSRLTSDMADRSHALHSLRRFPAAAGELLSTFLQILVTMLGIMWLDPPSAALAAAAALAAVVLPFATSAALHERDLRVRAHSGALARHYLDALLGLVAIRAHAAERAVRRQHESLLLEWQRACASYQRAALAGETASLAAGLVLAALLVISRLTETEQGSNGLLLAYWTLNLPFLGQRLAAVARQLPAFRNVALRAFEPLGAPEPQEPPAERRETNATVPTGVAIQCDSLAIRVSGRLVLEDVDLSISPGEHIAVVGESGAGKSSLVGTLLGWYRPAAGHVLADGTPIDQAAQSLRAATVWVDPAVHLWNRSLTDNLRYGNDAVTAAALAQAVSDAELRGVLEGLPEGLQGVLGEGGGLLSGGEAQRVRLGRGLLRGQARLVLLDEPFRGLERARRRRLLERLRSRFPEATLLYVSHDVADTVSFRRVLVVEAGRIVEDGEPRALLDRSESRYAALVAKDEAMQRVWISPQWRRLKVEEGRVVSGAQVGIPNA